MPTDSAYYTWDELSQLLADTYDDGYTQAYTDAGTDILGALRVELRRHPKALRLAEGVIERVSAPTF